MAVFEFVRVVLAIGGLHSMTSVLPNGGILRACLLSSCMVALDDVSATEWRTFNYPVKDLSQVLHSMTSVLPNGGG